MAEATLDKKSLKRQHEFPFNSFQFYNVPLLMGGTPVHSMIIYISLTFKNLTKLNLLLIVPKPCGFKRTHCFKKIDIQL